MNLKQALARAGETLTANNIEEAPLESELLLRHSLNIDRVQLYQDLSRELRPEQDEAFRQLVQRRIKGESSAYITGHREFYSIDFYVDRRVLIPRPESELLVEKAISLSQTDPVSSIADIGTGSGAIAVSLALNLPEAKIYATDISDVALEVALINCRRHGVADRVYLLQGDMLEPLPGAIDLIIANLPYVKPADMPRTQAEPLCFEPPLALNGGKDGLEKIYRLCRQAATRLSPQGCLLLEIGQGQQEAVADLLANLFPRAQIEVTPDLAGIERMVSLRLTPKLPR